jgi:hypothetical protein
MIASSAKISEDCEAQHADTVAELNDVEKTCRSFTCNVDRREELREGDQITDPFVWDSQWSMTSASWTHASRENWVAGLKES